MKKILLIILSLSALSVFADEEVYMMNPFEVNTSEDIGYLSSNATSAISLNSAFRSAEPPVVLTKKADYYAIQINIINDSRLKEERAKEIHSTLLNMIKEAKNKKYYLQYNDEKIDKSNYQIPLVRVNGKADTSKVEIILKVELGEDDVVKDLTESMLIFLHDLKMYGRTYVLTTGSGLSIKNPQSYRYELLKAISEDIEQVKSYFTGEVKLSINGLDKKIQVKQSSDKNVTLYIPYSFSFINSTND